MEIKQGIISSGLSGVSRLAMLWAYDKAYPFGGWTVPGYGSKTEAAADGLRLAKSLGSATRRNVHEAHGVLSITSSRALDPESVYAKKVCDGLSMPWLHVVTGDYNPQDIRRFIQSNWIEPLYITGDDAVTRHQCEAVLDIVGGSWGEFEIMILGGKVC